MFHFSAGRKKAIKNIPASEQLQTIIDNIASGFTMVVVDSQGNIEPIIFSNKYYQLLGYTKEQFENEVEDVFQFIHPDDLEDVMQKVLYANQSGESTSLEFRVTRRDGSERWLHDDISIVHFEGMEMAVQLSVFSDVTERKQTEIDLLESDQLLKMIVNNINGGLAVSTFDHHRQSFIFTNDLYFEQLGYTRKEFEKECPNGVIDRIHPDDLQMLHDMIMKTKESNLTETISFRAFRRDSTEIWLRCRSSISHLNSIDQPVHISFIFDVTSEIEASEALRIREMEYRLAIEGSDKFIYRYNHKDDSVDLTGNSVPIYGCNRHLTDVPESMIRSSQVADESIDQYRAFFRAVKRGDKSGDMTIRRKRNDGEWRWYAGYFRNIYDHNGKPISAIVVFGDVTEQREKEAVFEKWQNSLADKAPESFTLFRWNLNQDILLGDIEGSLLSFRKHFLGNFDARTKSFLERYVYPEDRERYAELFNIHNLLVKYQLGQRQVSTEFRLIMPNKQVLWVQLNIELVEYSNSPDVCAFIMYEDIDQHKREDLSIRGQAQLDPLTEVLNRMTFVNKFKTMMQTETTCALLLIDIDGFKLLNDTFGHTVGDQALIEMTETLRAIIRPTDLLGRLGGDEFFVGMAGFQNEAAIINKSRQIVSRLRKTYSPQIHTSVSIGIALFPQCGEDFNTLYRKADTALYYVKTSGKDSAMIFDEKMTDLQVNANNSQSANPPED